MKFISSLFFLLLASHLSAEIRECSTTEELLNHANQKTLIIFDIDNVILCPIQTLGTDPWFRYYKERLQDEGKSDKEALALAVDMLHRIYHKTRVKLIEKKTPTVIENLQKRKLAVIAMTTRSSEVADCTINHLLSLGVDMKKSRPLPQNFMLPDCPDVLFQDGVLFTTGTHKGTAFLSFLKRVNFEPECVVYINDKASHLREVEEACETRKIRFMGLRYSGADEMVKNFKPNIADLQQRYFTGIVPDDIANDLVQINAEMLQASG